MARTPAHRRERPVDPAPGLRASRPSPAWTASSTPTTTAASATTRRLARTPANAAVWADQARRHPAGAVPPDRRGWADRRSPTSTPRPSATTRHGHLVLADTGTNVDHRVVVRALPLHAAPVSSRPAYVEQDVAAEVIPLAYYTSATTSAKMALNVESMVDRRHRQTPGSSPARPGRPYAYVRDSRRPHRRPRGRARPARAGALVAADRGRPDDGRARSRPAAP